MSNKPEHQSAQAHKMMMEIAALRAENDRKSTLLGNIAVEYTGLSNNNHYGEVFKNLIALAFAEIGDSRMSKPICDCIEQTESGHYEQHCECNSGDLIDAVRWCDENNTRLEAERAHLYELSLDRNEE